MLCHLHKGRNLNRYPREERGEREEREEFENELNQKVAQALKFLGIELETSPTAMQQTT